MGRVIKTTKHKKSLQSRSRKKTFFSRFISGKVGYPFIIVGAVAGLAFWIGGGLYKPDEDLYTSPIPFSYSCCDTGEGANCHPQKDKPGITYDGTGTGGVKYQGGTYHLLKSAVVFSDSLIADSFDHLAPAPDGSYSGTNGLRVYINLTHQN